MENLVRRLGRIFSKQETKQEQQPAGQDCRRMDLLQESLSRWKEQKGWRFPDRTLNEAAERLDTDTVTLFHYFEERVGMDFRTWRTRLRLEDAKRLLAEQPELPASEIGLKTGFSNRSNFSRQFFAYTGRTPAQWRKEAGTSPDVPAPENDYV